MPGGFTGADARSDGAFLRHGQQQGVGGLGFQEGQGGAAGPAGGSPSVDQLLATFLNPTLPGARSEGPGDLKLALNGPGWLQLGDHGRGFPWQEGGGRGEGYPSEAPLPASWTMMLIGLALFGIFASYRKIKTTRLARTAPAALT